MNLQPINPPLIRGQRVQCCKCLRMVSKAKADIEATAGTYVCDDCITIPPAALRAEIDDDLDRAINLIHISRIR